jgi:hypothetical protein
MRWLTSKTAIWLTTKMTSVFNSLATGMVDRAGLSQSANFNALFWRTCRFCRIGFIGEISDLANLPSTPISAPMAGVGCELA